MARPLQPQLALSIALALAASTSAAFAADQPTGPAKTLAERTASMQHLPGLLPLDWDAKSGKLYLEVPLTANADHTGQMLW